MSEFINKFNNIFLKMDIEGHEYDWLNSLTVNQINNIKQIVIEFHLHLDDHWKEPLSTYCNSMIEKIKETHTLIHFHPNNCGSCMKVDNQDIPRVFECTFLRKDCMNNIFNLSKDEIPSNLDQINVLNRPNIFLKGYPYNTL